MWHVLQHKYQRNHKYLRSNKKIDRRIERIVVSDVTTLWPQSWQVTAESTWRRLVKHPGIVVMVAMVTIFITTWKEQLPPNVCL